MSVLESVEGYAFFAWLRESESIWAFPTALTLHTLGIMMLSGASAALDLRILGVGTGIPLASLRPLFTVVWGGFWLNAVTGAMLFGADATAKAAIPMFFVKLGLIVGGVVTLFLMRRRMHRVSGVVPPGLRLLAVLSLLIWTAVIIAGRLLAYIE